MNGMVTPDFLIFFFFFAYLIIIVAQFKLTLVDRNVTPRMPWHDMTVGMVNENKNQCL